MLPNTREKKALGRMTPGYWEHDTYPAGKQTRQALIDKGWIETRAAGGGRVQYRLTPAGEEARHAPTEPLRPRRDPRLTMLEPRVKPLKSRF